VTELAELEIDKMNHLLLQNLPSDSVDQGNIRKRIQG
jgi:hypothetical protein